MVGGFATTYYFGMVAVGLCWRRERRYHPLLLHLFSVSIDMIFYYYYGDDGLHASVGTMFLVCRRGTLSVDHNYGTTGRYSACNGPK